MFSFSRSSRRQALRPSFRAHCNSVQAFHLANYRWYSGLCSHDDLHGDDEVSTDIKWRYSVSIPRCSTRSAYRHSRYTFIFLDDPMIVEIVPQGTTYALSPTLAGAGHSQSRFNTFRPISMVSGIMTRITSTTAHGPKKPLRYPSTPATASAASRKRENLTELASGICTSRFWRNSFYFRDATTEGMHTTRSRKNGKYCVLFHAVRIGHDIRIHSQAGHCDQFQYLRLTKSMAAQLFVVGFR